jgi:hypothetical protein
VSSTLVQWYDAARADGCGHRAAVARIARRIAVDEATVIRTLGQSDKRFSTPPKVRTR